MKAEDLDRIKRNAKAATKGPWVSTWREECAVEEQTLVKSLAPEVDEGGVTARVIIGMIYYDGLNVAVTEPNADHIANCDPDTILALVEDSRRLEGIKQFIAANRQGWIRMTAEEVMDRVLAVAEGRE